MTGDSVLPAGTVPAAVSPDGVPDDLQNLTPPANTAQIAAPPANTLPAAALSVSTSSADTLPVNTLPDAAAQTAAPPVSTPAISIPSADTPPAAELPVSTAPVQENVQVSAKAAALTVRPMTAADLAAAAALEQFSPDPWNERQLEEELHAPFARCLVLCAAADGAADAAADGAADGAADAACGNVIGFCTAQLAADEATLNAITVAPASRGQGCGRYLLAALEKQLRAEGAAALYLEVRSQNAPAIALYRAMDYITTGRRPRFYRAPNDDAITMKKDL